MKMDFYRELIKKYGFFFDNINQDVNFECFSFMRSINQVFHYETSLDDQIIIKAAETKYVCNLVINYNRFTLTIEPLANSQELNSANGIIRKYLKYDGRGLTIKEMDIVDGYLRTQDINLNNSVTRPFYSNNVNYYLIDDLTKANDNADLYHYDSPLFNNAANIHSRLNKNLTIFRSLEKQKKGQIECLYPQPEILPLTNIDIQYSYYLGGMEIVGQRDFCQGMEGTNESGFFTKNFKKP